MAPLAMAIMAALFITACKKNNLPDAGGTRLSRIAFRSVSDSSGSVVLKYYDNGRLESTTNTYNDILFYRTRYFYDAAGKLERTEGTSFNNNHVFTYSYFYEGNNIVKKVLNAPPGQQVSYQYFYDAHGKLIVDSVFDASFTSSQYTDFTYTGDNLTKWSMSYRSPQIPWQSGGSFKATYNNIDNPFYELGLLSYVAGGLDLATGIPTLSKQLLATIEHPNGLVMHYDYDFYSNGLPRKVTVHSPSSIHYTGTYDFYYE